jgi:hypothetical protein
MKRRRRGAGPADEENVAAEGGPEGVRDADTAEARADPTPDRRANMATVARK